MTKAEEKQRLRAVMRQLERELSEQYKQTADQAIAAHLLALPEYQEADTVFCFVGTAREIDTRPILAAALDAGNGSACPCAWKKASWNCGRSRAWRSSPPVPTVSQSPPRTVP